MVFISSSYSIVDFTPSRGNTPNHQRSCPGTPQFNKAFSFDRAPMPKPQPSPTHKKKKLADLFKESMERDQMEDYQSAISDMKTIKGILTKSPERTPHMSKASSACSREATPTKDAKLEKEKHVKAAQCCMPRFVPNLSSSDRKKQILVQWICMSILLARGFTVYS